MERSKIYSQTYFGVSVQKKPKAPVKEQALLTFQSYPIPFSDCVLSHTSNPAQRKASEQISEGFDLCDSASSFQNANKNGRIQIPGNQQSQGSQEL